MLSCTLCSTHSRLTHSHTQMFTPADSHTCTHVKTRTYMHLRNQEYMHTCTFVKVHIIVFTNLLACAHTCTLNVHTLAQTFTHMHPTCGQLHIHIHSCSQNPIATIQSHSTYSCACAHTYICTSGGGWMHFYSFIVYLLEQ